MQVREIMTENPACCTEETTLKEAAAMMAENDCGAVPVTDEQQRPTGIVTDRDIACRAVGQGEGPNTPVRAVMSNPLVTVTPETSLEDCCEALDENQIRRAPVVDENGTCCGIVSQADIAQHAPDFETAQFIREISEPTAASSRLG